MSRTLLGLFLVGAHNKPRKRKRTNQENPRTIPEQIGKIPEKSGKSQKGRKRTKRKDKVQIGKPPRLNPSPLAPLDSFAERRLVLSIHIFTWQSKANASLVPFTRVHSLNHASMGSYALIFLSLLFWKKQGKPPPKTRIFHDAEPLKSLGKKGKTLKKARKFLAMKKARKSKKQGKEDQGGLSCSFSCCIFSSVSFGEKHFLWAGHPREFTPTLLPTRSANARNCLLIGFLLILEGEELGP